MANRSLTPEGFLADQPVGPPEVSDLHRRHLLFVSYPPRPGNRTGISLTPERPQKDGMLTFENNHAKIQFTEIHLYRADKDLLGAR